MFVATGFGAGVTTGFGCSTGFGAGFSTGFATGAFNCKTCPVTIKLGFLILFHETRFATLTFTLLEIAFKVSPDLMVYVVLSVCLGVSTGFGAGAGVSGLVTTGFGAVITGFSVRSFNT